MSSTTLFQYCQKLIIFSEDKSKVLLARRKGEADYNDVYSFIGGKMETTDTTILAGMKREKDEEIGVDVKIKVQPNETYNLLFRKKDDNSMILPHIAAIFVSGDIRLSEEYSDYQWIALDKLDMFEPKIKNIPDLVKWAKHKLDVDNTDELVEL